LTDLCYRRLRLLTRAAPKGGHIEARRSQGRRGLGWIAVTWVIAGCSFDTSGVGSGMPLGPGGSSPEGDGTLDDEGSGGTVGDSGASGSVGSGVDGTADGSPMDEGPSGHPVIIISDCPTFDFGPLVRA
jgi:hypothetical protein